MIQTKDAEIDIADAISSNLYLRASAIDFFEKIENAPAQKIVVDFRSVEFINRSFAHEYLTQKNKSTKTISEIHLSEDAQKMLEIVFNVHKNEFK
ncbi:MAG: STAS-like domain-containing protein [Methanimicrococcus sp.]|nr:STAS-like domain-containing protein [Methanimicrococcus sp.]